MNFRQLLKPLGGALRSYIPLGIVQQLVTDHKFLHGGGTQERGEIVGVKMEAGVVALVGGTLVKAHGIGEGGLEEIVVADGDAAQDVGKGVGLGGGEFVERGEMALAYYD